VQALHRYVSNDDFREALDKGLPGIIDPRSWAYRNSTMGRYPPRPLPKRSFSGEAPQPFTFRISAAQPSITGRIVSAFSDSTLNTTRETPRSS